MVIVLMSLHNKTPPHNHDNVSAFISEKHGCHPGEGTGPRVCSHVEILADGLFLLARRVRVVAEERVERLEHGA